MPCSIGFLRASCTRPEVVVVRRDDGLGEYARTIAKDDACVYSDPRRVCARLRDIEETAKPIHHNNVAGQTIMYMDRVKPSRSWRSTSHSGLLVFRVADTIRVRFGLLSCASL